MATNYKDFHIETKDGRILNLKDLCNFVENTPITPDDLPFVQSLCNKLANDDTYSNKYVNEYPLVDVMHKVLLEYYIKEYNFDMAEVLDTLFIFNKEAFTDIDRLSFDGIIYLIYDKNNDIDVINIRDEKEFIDFVLANLRIVVSGTSEEIFKALKQSLPYLRFNVVDDSLMNNYAQRFDISDSVYFAKDINGNNIYKIKNGLFIKNGKDVSTIIEPTFLADEEKREQKVVAKNKKYKEFDLEDFITLKDKTLNGEALETDEIRRFYYEVRYLINTMGKRTREDREITKALDEYMEEINKIYLTHPDLLTDDDRNNYEDYSRNRSKYRQAA